MHPNKMHVCFLVEYAGKCPMGGTQSIMSSVNVFNAEKKYFAGGIPSV